MQKKMLMMQQRSKKSSLSELYEEEGEYEMTIDTDS